MQAILPILVGVLVFMVFPDLLPNLLKRFATMWKAEQAKVLAEEERTRFKAAQREARRRKREEREEAAFQQWRRETSFVKAATGGSSGGGPVDRAF